MPATRNTVVKRAARGAKTASRRKTPGAPAGEISRLVEKLSAEDVKLSLPLLNAAVSGVILGFNPDDAQMRRLAAKSWKRLKPLLSRHLTSEDESVIPWAETQREFPRAKVEKFKKRHEELRSFVQTINSVDFETGERADVSRAGKALCRLAVRLDDLIEGEERELFPMLRRFLMAQGQPMEESSGC
jgi:hemerythrin-like domain-containing protein